MTNGCPKCEEREKELYHKWKKLTKEKRGLEILTEITLCLDCQLEQADADLLKAMNRVEEIKQKIKEQEHA